MLALGVWGLLWMAGFFASTKVFRHLIDVTGIRIRQGTRADIRIPWDAIESVNAQRDSVATSKPVQAQQREDVTVVVVPVLKQTRVVVALRRPTAVQLPCGTQEISEVRFYVDDPRGFVAAARSRLSHYSAATSHQ